MMKRVFLADVLACACGGTRRVVAQIDEGPIARKILTHLGLPATPPRPTPARGQPQLDLWDTGPPPAAELTSEREEPEFDPPPDLDFDQRLHESEQFAC